MPLNAAAAIPVPNIVTCWRSHRELRQLFKLCHQKVDVVASLIIAPLLDRIFPDCFQIKFGSR